jgi:hypothetical protein
MMVPEPPAAAHEESIAELEIPLPAQRRPAARPREDFDEFFDFGPGFDPYAAPPRPRRRRKPRRKKKPKWVLPTLIAGGSVLGLLLVGLVIYAMARQFSVETLDVDEPLAYLTVDTEFVFILNYAELKRDPNLAVEFRRGNVDKDLEFIKELGMEPDDIVRLAYGLANANDDNDPDVAIQRSRGMLLIQSRKKFNRFSIGFGEIKARHAGKQYLKDRVKQSGVTYAAFFPNETTLIVASESTIKKLLEADRPSLARSPFAFAEFGSPVVIAYAARRGKTVPIDPPQGKESFLFEITEPASILSPNLRGVAICRKYGREVSGTAYVSCGDAREAAGLEAALLQSPEKRRAMADHLTPPTLENNAQAAQEGLQNLRITTSGSTLVVSTRFPNSR